MLSEVVQISCESFRFISEKAKLLEMPLSGLILISARPDWLMPKLSRRGVAAWRLAVI